jgi:hypothetical protein
VQNRLRRGSAKTTLDTYGHLWPDKDRAAEATIDAVIEAKSGDSADCEGGTPWRTPSSAASKYYTS